MIDLGAAATREFFIVTTTSTAESAGSFIGSPNCSRTTLLSATLPESATTQLQPEADRTVRSRSLNSPESYGASVPWMTVRPGEAPTSVQAKDTVSFSQSSRKYSPASMVMVAPRAALGRMTSLKRWASKTDQCSSVSRADCAASADSSSLTTSNTPSGT
ncbi:hypothetical protein D9T14_07405 [Propionibacterium australiense]|uniref:Uncharacterized protein n=1 Tax=Propionibacterium australiense TaxID=119981 RepID=A0A8B3FPN8_9ACTN|nr:hypothetical protein D9T14_07405 [Propionibacterium australiense]RLP09855.1 hypothetical protein D7U36_06640 [Propionibacterium australiense]